MTITLPEPYDLPQTGLAQTLFGGIGQGIQEGMQSLIQKEKQRKESRSLGQVLGFQEEKLDAFQDLNPLGQELVVKQQIEDQKRLQQLALEKKRQEDKKQLKLEEAKINAEWNSPEIKKYKESLGLREETATQLMPALENARLYKDDMSRFVPGTAASKALGDLATRAFAFYKPLFGGRLTQKEFVNSIANLSSNRSLPGGFNQALNLIESMIAQGKKEADLFNDYLDTGLSPSKARRNTLKDMRSQANDILNILQKGTEFDIMKGFDKIPALNKIPEGKKFRDNKTGKIMKREGNKLIEVNE